MKYYLNKNHFFITCRTFDQKNYFLFDYQKQILLNKFKETEEFFRIRFIAYAILSNHYHILTYLDNGAILKKILQRINGGTSYALNKIDGINRAIWGEYYNSNITDEKSYYKVMGYILGNPFKHGLVKSVPTLKNYIFCNYNEKVKELGEETINEIIQSVISLNWEINLNQ